MPIAKPSTVNECLNNLTKKIFLIKIADKIVRVQTLNFTTYLLTQNNNIVRVPAFKIISKFLIVTTNEKMYISYSS